MKNYLSIIVLLFTMSLLTMACENLNICIEGQGSSVTQTLEIDPFTGIDQKISADVFISQGSPQSVEVTGQQNIIDELRSSVSNGVWKIDTRSGCFRNYETLQIHITVPELTSASISGSGQIIGETSFMVEDLDLEISGSGLIKLEAEGGKPKL